MLKLVTRWFLAPVLAALAVFAAVSPSEAAWLFYHRPAYEGRILDGESGGPIEGAVVVAIYNKQTFDLPGPSSGIIHVKETVTDKDGRFRIPSYTTLINPFAWGSEVGFTIFKPGYASINEHKRLEGVFTNKDPDEPENPWYGSFKIKFGPGKVSLPRISDRKDRLRSHDLIAMMPEVSDKSPLLKNAVRDDYKAIWAREDSR